MRDGEGLCRCSSLNGLDDVNTTPKHSALRIHTDLLAEVSNWFIVLVQDDADLVHEADLLLIVPLKCGTGGIDIGEEAEDVVCRDGFDLGGRGSGHFQLM